MNQNTFNIITKITLEGWFRQSKFVCNAIAH